MTWLIWPLCYAVIALEVAHEVIRFQRSVDGDERYARLSLWERLRFPLLAGGLWPGTALFVLWVVAVSLRDGD